MPSPSPGRPSDVANGQSIHPVVIIRAGPVGLACALDLASLGIRTIVIEKREGVQVGSRAVGIRRRSLQIFDHLGVFRAIRAAGYVLERGWTYYGTKLVNESIFQDETGSDYPNVLLLQQDVLEEMLIQRAREFGSVDIRWCHTLRAMDQSDDRLRLSIAAPDGPYTLDARFVVAADGAHSDVRRILGISYLGARFEQRWVIADFHTAASITPGRRLWFDPPYQVGSTTILYQLPGNTWRLDYLVPDGEDPAEAATPQKATERIRAHLAMMKLPDDWQLLRCSAYSPSALSLESYRQGRVLFAGDAAHLTPIFSGRGMNHGIEDIHNLSWKLAQVIRHQRDPAILDTYTLERRPAVLATLNALSKTTVYMSTPSRGARLMRSAALSLASGQPGFRSLFEPFQLGEFVPSDSPLNGAPHREREFHGEGPGSGSTVPDFPIELDQNGQRRRCSIYQLLGKRFLVLYFMDSGCASLAQIRELPTLAADVEIILVASDATSIDGFTTIADRDGSARRALAATPGTCYLIRPDDVIAARWRTLVPQELISALEIAGAGLTPKQYS